MNTNLGYKIEKISVSSIFKSFQYINKVVQDKYNADIIWLYLSRDTSFGLNNSLVKYNKSSKTILKTYDFGECNIYSIHVSNDYVGVLSIPSNQPTKRFLSVINKSTEVIQSHLYTVPNNQPLEFLNIFIDNKMIFDGRYYWVLPNSSSIPIIKVDIINTGASSGTAGLNAPGGSSLNAITETFADWSPVTANFDNKAYVFNNKIYFFPKGNSIFTIDITTNAKQTISNPEWNSVSNTLEFCIGQYGQDGEFSKAGQIILLALRDSSALTDPVNTLGMMDLQDMEFASYKFMDNPDFKGSKVNIIADNTENIFFTLMDNQTTGYYLNVQEGLLEAYNVLSLDNSNYSRIKSPIISLDDNTVLCFTVNSIYAYKLTKETPCKVYVNHILEDGSLHGSMEIIYGLLGQNYTIQPKLIEGKEVISKTANYTGKFTQEDIVVTINYAPVKINTFIKVQYVDQNNNVLQEYSLEGFVGDNYTTDSIDIAGYILTNIPSNSIGTLQENNPAIVYTYRQLTEEELYKGNSFISISYKDDSGNIIMPAKSQRYSIGEEYSITAPTIPGFTLLSKTTVSGLCFDNTHFVEFIYKKKSTIGIGKINYICNGYIIRTDYIEGTAGVATTYTPTAMENLDISLTPINITPTNAITTVSVVCTPVSPLLILKHTDAYDNSSIYANELIFLNSGVKYTFHSKIINNYKQINETPTYTIYNSSTNTWSIYENDTPVSSVSGLFSDLEFVYDTVESSVEVFYKYGNTVLDSYTINGLNGDTYHTSAIEYEEYEILEIQGYVSGKLSSRPSSVVYKYKLRVCTVNVEYIDITNNNVILKEVYTKDYGTTLNIPYKTFQDYIYIKTNTNQLPTNIIVTFKKDIQTISFYYVKFNPSAMLVPTLSINSSKKGIDVATNGFNDVIYGLRYIIERSKGAGSFSNIFAKSSIKVLNIINTTADTTVFTPYGSGQPITIPSKAILKKWCEEGNNGITVDYIDAQYLDSDVHLKDIDNKYKYDVIVNGTYSDTESCILSDKTQSVIDKYIDDGYGYIDCSIKYKSNNRADLVPTSPTDAQLLIQIIKELGTSTGCPLWTDINVTSTKPNVNVDIENIQYDKIFNTITIKVKLVNNGENNPPVIYNYKIKIINCNDGNTYLSSQGTTQKSIDCTLPIIGYSMAVDHLADTIPIINNIYSNPLVYVRKENINIIDNFLHIIGVDAFNNKTNVFHSRYYKEITIEDLGTINSVITYSPKLVKQNHRARGPIESLKLNNFNTEVKAAIDELYSIIDSQNNKLTDIESFNNIDIHYIYNNIKDRSELNE